MRRWGRLLTAFFALAVPAVFAAQASLAAPATGCSASVRSFSDRGIPLDKFKAPGPGGTESQPFHVIWNGKIDWNGKTGQVIRDGTWKVSLRSPYLLFKIAELAGVNGASGKIANRSGKRTSTGSVSPKSKIPVMLPGIYEATFTATGADGARCSGTVWVKIVSSPTGTPLFWAALVLILVAIIIFVYSGLSWLRPVLSRAGE